MSLQVIGVICISNEVNTILRSWDLPSMETRHKVEQVKTYLNAMQNPKNPLHDAVKEEKGCRLARGKSWMSQAEQSIQLVCSLTEIKQVWGWGKRPVEFKPYNKTLLSAREPRHTLPWMASWKNQCRSTNACRSQQQATWHCDLHRRLSHKGPVWLGVHSQAGWKDCARRQWSPQSHDL